PIGPYTYNVHVWWFGKLDHAFAIAFKRDENGRTAQSERYVSNLKHHPDYLCLSIQ
ncbi:hypothetical protein V1505DRAFT_309894, partial [Lipomyces doorenjongii]